MSRRKFGVLYLILFIGILLSVISLGTAETVFSGILSAVVMWFFCWLLKRLIEAL